MRVVLFNGEIYDTLICCGFHYCYSKTVFDDQATARVSIYLTPVHFKPDIRKLPLRYDTYYNLAEEPVQMAMGIDDDTDVFIHLDDTILKEYYEQKNFDY